MAWVRKFLFHIGAIKSVQFGIWVACGNAMFLFHIGAIKRLALWCYTIS